MTRYGPAGIYPAKPIDHRAQLALRTRSNLVRSRPGRSAFLLRLWSYLAVQQRAKLSLHVPPLRAAVVRPGCLLRSALPAACRASLLWPFRGSFPGPQACFRYICPAACLTALPAPFLAFLRCLSQYVPPPAALLLLCLPLLPCSAFLKRKGRPASAVVCFAASLPALALPGLPGIRTKDKGRPALLSVSAVP